VAERVRESERERGGSVIRGRGRGTFFIRDMHSRRAGGRKPPSDWASE
jgi:hypothetical protein